MWTPVQLRSHSRREGDDTAAHRRDSDRCDKFRAAALGDRENPDGEGAPEARAATLADLLARRLGSMAGLAEDGRLPVDPRFLESAHGGGVAIAADLAGAQDAELCPQEGPDQDRDGDHPGAVRERPLVRASEQPADVVCGLVPLPAPTPAPVNPVVVPDDRPPLEHAIDRVIRHAQLGCDESGRAVFSVTLESAIAGVRFVRLVALGEGIVGLGLPASAWDRSRAASVDALEGKLAERGLRVVRLLEEGA
jgi:hypothetical protein